MINLIIWVIMISLFVCGYALGCLAVLKIFKKGTKAHEEHYIKMAVISGMVFVLSFVLPLI